MHEAGHNLGFGHSDENGVIREDKSGSMGRSIIRVGGPQQCFNGQKYFMGGWLWDRFREADMRTDPTPWLGRLVAFTDHQNSQLQPADTTLLRVVIPDGMDLFVLYNKAKSFNNGVREKANQVTIVQTSVESSVVSEMLAGLNVGESFSIQGLTVTVCTAVEDKMTDIDYVVVNVYKTSQSSTCDEYAPIPTKAPSPKPSPAPTKIPVAPIPTKAPSPKPSPAPTKIPVAPIPTKAPSPKPSPAPTNVPVAGIGTPAPTIKTVQSPNPWPHPFNGFFPGTGMDQCTAQGDGCDGTDECCGMQICRIPRGSFGPEGDKKCCLSVFFTCTKNSECCNGRCRSPYGRCL
jgi:hypothetical protein